MKLPYVSIASDGRVQFWGIGFPHSRSYGTFPRVIPKYVKEENVLSLEDAIRKMTSLPAEVFRIKNRGLIKEGFFADLVIFDFERIKDNATFRDPHQYPSGIIYVIVNGKIVIDNGKHTGEYSGMIIKKGKESSNFGLGILRTTGLKLKRQRAKIKALCSSFPGIPYLSLFLRAYLSKAPLLQLR